MTVNIGLSKALSFLVMMGADNTQWVLDNFFMIKGVK